MPYSLRTDGGGTVPETCFARPHSANIGVGRSRIFFRNYNPPAGSSVSQAPGDLRSPIAAYAFAWAMTGLYRDFERNYEKIDVDVPGRVTFDDQSQQSSTLLPGRRRPALRSVASLTPCVKTGEVQFGAGCLGGGSSGPGFHIELLQPPTGSC